MSEQTYVWTVRADGKWNFHVSPLNSETITAKVAAIRATLDLGGIARQPPPFAAREAQDLYTVLLAPTEEFRRGQKHLVISAGGSLVQLPFAILQTDAGSDSWLIRQTAISHVPSASIFLALRSGGPHHSAKQAFAGFGDPVFSKQGKPTEGLAFRSLKLPRQMLDSREYKSALKGLADLPALPETREEIFAIADALGANPQRDVFVGDAASRSNVLTAPLSDRRVLAFSTHGLLPGDLPGLDQPALALAFEDGSTDLPLLTMEDVLGLKLNADWVVLSACNTAAENGRSGEAISGLGQAFFYAGARSLLLTHWAVESNSARDLVSHTFRIFAAHPQGMRAEALRAAQLQMADSVRYAHPFFWAAYALEGDGGF